MLLPCVFGTAMWNRKNGYRAMADLRNLEVAEVRSLGIEPYGTRRYSAAAD